MKLRIHPFVTKDLKYINDFNAKNNADKVLEIVQEILPSV